MTITQTLVDWMRVSAECWQPRSQIRVELQSSLWRPGSRSLVKPARLSASWLNSCFDAFGTTKVKLSTINGHQTLLLEVGMFVASSTMTLLGPRLEHRYCF